MRQPVGCYAPHNASQWPAILGKRRWSGIVISGFVMFVSRSPLLNSSRIACNLKLNTSKRPGF